MNNFKKYFPPFVSTNKIGFRISIVDLVFILLASIITYYYPQDFLEPPFLNLFLHCFIPYLVCNFFLFCNVFRVRTKYELCWIGVASINMLVNIGYYNNIIAFFSYQSVVTCIIIMLEIKSKTYHGVFAKNKEIKND